MRVLRDEVRSGRTQWGAFVGTNSPLAAEIMARAGFDWIAVDLQHSPGSGTQQLASMITAVAAADVPTIVRIPWKGDVGSVMAALDAGAQGVIVPMVDTAAEAAAAGAASKYPPAGNRSYGPWRVHMLHDDYGPDVGDRHAVCLVQIETTGGLQNIEEILAEPTVDGAYVGPQDLSLSHGGAPDWHRSNAVLVDLADRVLQACRRHAKIAVAHTADAGEAAQWGELGFDMVTATSDTWLLQTAADDVVATVHRTDAP